MKPSPKIIMKFPSPTNLSTKYKDQSNNCYKYKSEEVKCDKKAIAQPIIEEFKNK